MHDLILKTPSILKVGGVCSVYDNIYKSEFYTTKKEQKYFSLPKGNYKLSQPFELLKFKRVYTPTPTKEREKNYFFRNFAPLKFAENKNVATVYHKDKKIVFDNSLNSKPFLFQAFILYHEIGHKFYNTEWKCDVFSCIRLLESGYNQSQVLDVCKSFLAVKHPDRFKHCQKVIKKSNLSI